MSSKNKKSHSKKKSSYTLGKQPTFVVLLNYNKDSRLYSLEFAGKEP